MSPIEQIKDGIINGNWDTVCSGYKNLTGEVILQPGTSDSIIILQKIADIIFDSNGFTKIPKKKKPGRPKKDRENQTSHEDDPSLKLYDNNKTTVQRETGGVRLITNYPSPEEISKNKEKSERANINKTKRQPSRTFKVECNECNQSFESNRRDSEIGQKCSKCLRKRK